MTADLTREEIEQWRPPGAASESFARLLAAAEAHLDKPARLSAARAEGVREGIERCAAEARRYSRHYGPGSDCRNTFVLLAECFDRWAAALSPAPAEAPTTPTEATDWTVSDTELARDILSYLGIGSDASLEPGDRRRDRIAAMICADRERRIVKLTEASAPVADGK